MSLDPKAVGHLLSASLRREVGVDLRPDGSVMLRTPFAFPDGDGYPIRLSEAPDGRLRLSDDGHTLMHLSFEHEVDDFLEGARGALLERVRAESGIEWDGGAFCLDTTPESLLRALFRFGQALTRVGDLAFLASSGVEPTRADGEAERATTSVGN